MSTIPLSDIQEVIERSLFESIRQELVDKGYIPDISDTTTYPDNEIGFAKWKTDIQTIIDGPLGFVIELFGTGNNQAKGDKKIPRIVIDSGSFLPGALGGDPQRVVTDENTHFSSYRTPPQTTDFYINFHLVSNSSKQSRILNSILALSIPKRGYIKFYNDSTKSFFVRYLNYYNEDNEDKGIIENTYAYEIPDAWDISDTPFDNISKMVEITWNTNIQKYLDGSWGSDSGSTVIT